MEKPLMVRTFGYEGPFLWKKDIRRVPIAQVAKEWAQMAKKHPAAEVAIDHRGRAVAYETREETPYERDKRLDLEKRCAGL